MRKISCSILLITNAIYLTAQDKQISDTIDSVALKNKIIKIQEIQIKGRLNDANIKSGLTGLDIDVKELKLLPKLIGETDPYRALQYMGGVSQAGEANSGLYVRGGNNDQNLILLNGTMIQNPTHVLGMFSVFNPDLIGQMRFIKSGMPAEYGGRLSSVVDISTINTIPEKTEIKGSIGIISSRLSAHIPISSKLSVYGSWRGSYISSIILPTLVAFGVDSLLTQNKYEYWDVNAGFVYYPAPRTKLTGHFYSGKDDIKVQELEQFNLKSNNSTGWENTAAGLQLNHIFTDTWSMNHQLNYSKFHIQSGLDWYNSLINMQSQFDNLTYKADFFHANGQHKFKFGTELSYNVTISDGEHTEILTSRWDKNHFPPYVYRGTELKGVEGKTYYLTVDYGGYTLYSQTTIPYATDILNFKTEPVASNDTLRLLSMTFEIDPAKKNAYRVFTKKKKDGFYIQTPIVFNSELSLSGTNTFNISPKSVDSDLSASEGSYFAIGDTVQVKLCTIDSISTQFFKALTIFSSSGIGTNAFIGEKDPLKSNISSPGFGIWYGNGTKIYQVVIK